MALPRLASQGWPRKSEEESLTVGLGVGGGGGGGGGLKFVGLPWVVPIRGDHPKS